MLQTSSITFGVMMSFIKKIVFSFSVIFFSAISWGNTPEQGYSLSVKVSHLRNSKGIVQFSLYNKDGTIPDENYQKFYKQLQGKIKAGVSVVTFSHLPEGRYAVNILHDENQNKKIDKGFLLPIEGVGFSNYKSIGLRNRPNFSKASFTLNADITKQINIIYF